MMRPISLILIVPIAFFLLTGRIAAQYMQQTLFPGDSSFLLVQKLVQQFKPAVVLDYSQARVKMYQNIYNESDSVECVYSGHKLYLDPSSSDPIGYLIKNGNANGINCEHTFPQSKGAETGNAKSDMHHLFPSRAAVNEARSNYPFGEIADANTDRWFYRSFTQTSIPLMNKDAYSESITGMFEPREQHKGNVARAIFYFFTMYELQADRSFFESMKQTLCVWHLADPVDSTEWNRSQFIGSYQEGKANPFTLDCSLPYRCNYCTQNIPLCSPTLVGDLTSEQIQVYPNPASYSLQLEFPKEHTIESIEWYNGSGIKLKVPVPISFSQNGLLQLEIQDLPCGIYSVHIGLDHHRQAIKQVAIYR